MLPPTLLVLAASLAPLASPAPRAAAGEGPRTFVGELAEAYERGRVRNAPVVLLMMLDDQADDVRDFREFVLEDKQLAKHAEHLVLVVASPETHTIETVTVERDGERVEVSRCARYRSRTCEEHQRPWTALYVEFQQADGELYLPQAIVKTPDGAVHQRFNTRQAPNRGLLLDAIAGARKLAGPDISWEDLQRVRGLQREAAKFTASKRHGRALKAWAGIRALTEVPAYADEALRGEEAALAGMHQALADAVAACGDVEDVIPGYEQLLQLVPDFEDTPLERDLDKAVRKVEKDKRHKQRIAAYKREREAEALLREAEDAVAAGDDRAAEKLVRRLVRKFDDTEAARTARFKYPDWAK